MTAIRILCALCLFLISSLAAAANYTLWINGRTGGSAIGNYNDFSYWGPSTIAVCANSDGTAQTGWNIKWVRAASGAAGGSELSDAGSWTPSGAGTRWSSATTARTTTTMPAAVGAASSGWCAARS